MITTNVCLVILLEDVPCFVMNCPFSSITEIYYRPCGKESTEVRKYNFVLNSYLLSYIRPLTLWVMEPGGSMLHSQYNFDLSIKGLNI